MKKMFAVAVLASVAVLAPLGACGGSKKSDTTPSHVSPETGGAGGGAKYGGRIPPSTSKTPSASANPCAGK